VERSSRWPFSGLLHLVVWLNFTDISEAASISETSANFFQTSKWNDTEDSYLHTLCHENRKSEEIKEMEKYNLSVRVIMTWPVSPYLSEN
jgi:phage-related protein